MVHATARFWALLTALLVVAPSCCAQSVVAGDTLRIRFLNSVSAATRGAIRAMTIAPLLRDGYVVVPPGAIVDGVVDSAGVDNTRSHWLALHFDRLRIPIGNSDTTNAPIRATMRVLDNAREAVTASGAIKGPPSPSLVRSKRGWALLAIGTLHPVGALAAAAVIETEERERHRGVEVLPGFEGAIVVDRGAVMERATTWASPAPIDIDTRVMQLVDSLPRRSTIRAADTPGDIITLALIGTADQVKRAFANAGWDSTATVSLRTDFITFARAARAEGYAHQPVSLNYVAGEPPVFVFQKLADTFAKRHHLRVWRAKPTIDGSPVWLVAASRDLGVEFSTARRTFAHRTDPKIDDERDKVMNDLIAAGAVDALAMIEREPIVGVFVNDGSTPVHSDWRVALLRLR